MNQKSMICPNCQVAMQLGYRPHYERSCQEVWTCARCHEKIAGSLREGEVHVEPEFVLRIVWRPDELTTEKIKALRSLDARLLERPISDIVGELQETTFWEINGLSYWDVEKLKKACDEAQLKYEIK